MERQTFMLNLTLTVGIAALGFLIYDSPVDDGSDEVSNWSDYISSEDSVTSGPVLETMYNAELAQKSYPNFGVNNVFKPLMTPTPTPTPTPPPPEPTPDIHDALKSWLLCGVSDGVVTIENKDEKDPERQFFDLKKTQTVTLPIRNARGETVPRKLTIKKMSEYADNPYVTFNLEGSGEDHTIKQMPDEP